jgi:hypothetical protein
LERSFNCPGKAFHIPLSDINGGSTNGFNVFWHLPTREVPLESKAHNYIYTVWCYLYILICCQRYQYITVNKSLCKHITLCHMLIGRLKYLFTVGRCQNTLNPLVEPPFGLLRMEIFYR